MEQPRARSGDSSSDELEEGLHQLCLSSYTPARLSLLIDDINLKMELDTGSAISCISKKIYDKYFNSRVQYKNKAKYLELFVIDGGITALLGRQWLTELEIKVPPFQQEISNHSHVIHKVPDTVNSLLNRYKELFSGGLGRYTGGKATLRLREGARPVFCRARPLPYALRGPVDVELDAMLRAGVIEPMECSEWAKPLVPVRKADGGLRICADYKVTLNPVLLVDRYPLPKINDLLVSLNSFLKN
ncbi:unnamed protein product [Arctia plantaginis]|uniref:Uncharacterized protein n=1 Tax=Arctia plantaginis TaxID=874455 RepID=A0A8S1B467_ARCPL|nr:unnamed protein product [Arctia plantaginis]